jgi:hypothetical protein
MTLVVEEDNLELVTARGGAGDNDAPEKSNL